MTLFGTRNNSSLANAKMCYGTVFALFYCEFEGNFQVQAPGGSYLEGDLTECFLRYEFGGGGGGLYLEGLVHGGAYIFGILR